MRYRATITIDGQPREVLDLEVDTLAGALRSVALHAEPLELAEGASGAPPRIATRLEPYQAPEPGSRDPRDG